MTIRVEKLHGGNLLRLIELKDVRTLLILVAQNAKHGDVFVLVNLPTDYDLVGEGKHDTAVHSLQVVCFKDERSCAKFVHDCEHALRADNRLVTVRETSTDNLLAMAETHQGRQHRLEQFFRCVFS